jgi:hypothetical protein
MPDLDPHEHDVFAIPVLVCVAAELEVDIVLGTVDPPVLVEKDTLWALHNEAGRKPPVVDG